MLSDRCLSCLSVTLVYCGQVAEWIKMSFSKEVGLGPDDIVSDGDPPPVTPPRKGAQQLPRFGPCLLWSNGRLSTAELLFSISFNQRRLCDSGAVKHLYITICKSRFCFSFVVCLLHVDLIV